MATDWLFALFIVVMTYIVPVAGLGFLYYLYKGNGQIRYISSWGDLEKHFAVTAIRTNHRITSGQLGMWHFRGILKVAFDQIGVFIDVPDLFNFGKKLLHIPYDEFALTEKFPC